MQEEALRFRNTPDRVKFTSTHKVFCFSFSPQSLNRRHTLPAILVVAIPIPLYFSVTTTKGMRQSRPAQAF